MEQSKNLLVALKKMLAMKIAVDEPTVTLDPIPSTSGLSTSSARKRLHVSDETSPTKKRRVEHSVQKSVGNTFATIPIRVSENIDMKEFLNIAKDEIRTKISEELDERNALKFYIIVKTQLSRTNSDGDEQIATPYFCSVPKIILQSTDIADEIDNAGERIKELLATHEGHGSGFKLDIILDCQLQVATYDRIGGSSYIPLPKYIQSKKATVNIKNTDEKCFLFCMSYVRNPPNSNVPNRAFHYKKDLQNFNVDGLKFPLAVKQIPKFEAQNKEFSVNVYALDEIKSKTRDNKAILFPLYNTKERNRKYHANLLFITSGEKRHYVVIKSLSRLLAGRTADTSGRQSFVCKFCLYSFSSELLLKKHEVSCSEHAAVNAQFPVEPMNILKFKNHGNSLEVPFVIYADFEAILVEVDDDENKSTRKLNKHVPCGFACLTTSSCEQYNKEEVVVYSGPDCMSRFFSHLNSERLRINKILSKIIPIEELTPEQLREHKNAKKCFNCDAEFFYDHEAEVFTRAAHHDHISGKYIGPACVRCNLALKYKQSTRAKKNRPAEFEIPVVFHNLKGYDSKLILEHFPELNERERVSCIATNMEQFLTFTYRGLKFIDSCQFMKTSLAVLAENLRKSGEEKFVHTKQHFQEHFDLVTRKGVYCYSYMSSFEEFDETELPPIHCFYNDLTETHITETEYQHAKDVWAAFEMTSLKQYYDTYLATDVLILADVMTEFSRVCIRDYGLDPKHYVSLPGFS